MGYIATVRKLLMDRIEAKGITNPGVVVSLDSGAGKFLVTGKVYDRDNLSGMIYQEVNLNSHTQAAHEGI